MVPTPLHAAILALLLLAGPAAAATLTITPDKSTYLVGETITLDVVGDAQGTSDNRIFGRVVFDGILASYVDSSQVGLTSFSGSVPWIVGGLSAGDGFADAFNQFSLVGGTPLVPDGPLFAMVTLLASTPGELPFAWNTTGDSMYRLDFFGLTDAVGGSVTIVPEPATGLLLGVGLIGLALKRTRTERD